MKRFAWLVSCIVAIGVTTAADAQHQPNPLSGKRLYRSYCLVCHGAGGTASGILAKKLSLTPADLSSAQYQAEDVTVLAALIGGYGRREGSTMPRWSEVLGESDLYDIAAYVPKLGREDLKYRGNTRKGRAIYKSACVACHGRFGRGDGVLARLIGIPMIDFTNSGSLAKFNDEALLVTIREGKGAFMPSWKSVFDEEEIVDVGSYVRTLPAMALATSETGTKPNPLVGRRLYLAYCLVCHGADGKSIGPLAQKLDFEPADLSSEQYRMKAVDDLAVIIEGYGRAEGSMMPSWGKELPRQNLRDIAAYVTELSRVDLAYTGDRRRGRAIFKDACIACHGPSGRGDGVLAQLIGIPMVDFTESGKMAQLSDEELISTIRKGKGAFMPSWKDTFVESEITDVGSYVRALGK